MNDHNDVSKYSSGLSAVLNGSIRIPNWLSALVLVVATMVTIGSTLRRNAKLRNRWRTPDRPKIQTLEATRQQIAIENRLNLEMGVVRRSETMLKLADARSPERAAYLNSLANAYAAREDPGKARPLYEEARNLLEEFLGEDNPDVVIVTENMKQSQSQ